MIVIPHKRGDTFSLDAFYTFGTETELPAKIKAQLRTDDDALVQQLDVTRIDDAGGHYRLSTDATLPSATTCKGALANYDSGTGIQLIWSDGVYWWPVTFGTHL